MSFLYISLSCKVQVFIVPKWRFCMSYKFKKKILRIFLGYLNNLVDIIDSHILHAFHWNKEFNLKFTYFKENRLDRLQLNSIIKITSDRYSFIWKKAIKKYEYWVLSGEKRQNSINLPDPMILLDLEIVFYHLSNFCPEILPVIHSYPGSSYTPYNPVSSYSVP